MDALSMELAAGVVLALLSGLGSLVWWLFRTVGRNSGRTAAIEKRMEDLDDRWSARLEAMDDRWSARLEALREREALMPKAEDVHALNVTLTELRGDMGVLSERSRALGHVLDRHERWLEQGKFPGA